MLLGYGFQILQCTVLSRTVDRAGLEFGLCPLAAMTTNKHPAILILVGAGPDGVEEIKRHPFFATIDWNVGVSHSNKQDQGHKAVKCNVFYS